MKPPNKPEWPNDSNKGGGGTPQWRPPIHGMKLPGAGPWKIVAISAIIALTLIGISSIVHSVRLARQYDAIIHYELVVKTERQILGVLNETDSTLKASRNKIYSDFKDSVRIAADK